MSLVSRAVIKSDWLNIASVDTSRDAMIDRFIGYVDREIQDMCNQPIEQQTVVLSFNGIRDTLYHTTYTVPLVLTTLESRNSYGDQFVVVTGTTSVVDIDGTQNLYLSDGFTALQYKATMLVGFTTVPTTIALCAAEMVTELFMSTPYAPQANRFGTTAISESEAGMTVTKTLQRMRDRVRPRLSQYTRITI